MGAVRKEYVLCRDLGGHDEEIARFNDDFTANTACGYWNNKFGKTRGPGFYCEEEVQDDD